MNTQMGATADLELRDAQRVPVQYRTCKLCGSLRLRLVYTSSASGLQIVRCKACGLFFVGNEFSVAHHDDVYQDEAGYAGFVEAQRSVPSVKQRHQQWVAWLHRYVSATPARAPSGIGPTLLDIGCGAGDFLAVARNAGFDVFGIEISRPAAMLARVGHGIAVEVGAVESFYPKAPFDVVTMIGLLEHVTDPVLMLAQANRLVAPGGVLFVYTPVWGLFDVLTSNAARMTGGRLSGPIDRRINQAHLQIFPKRTLVRYLDGMGLRTMAAEVVCEYNLPVQEYLHSIGIQRGRIRSAAVALCQELIERRLFFRNNMRVIAKKVV